jgi:hypothetical protein
MLGIPYSRGMPAQSLTEDTITIDQDTSVNHIAAVLRKFFPDDCGNYTSARHVALPIYAGIESAREHGLDPVQAANLALGVVWPDRDQTHPLASFLVAVSDWRPVPREKRIPLDTV